MVNRASPVAQQVDSILNNLVLKFTVVNGTTAATNIAVCPSARSASALSARSPSATGSPSPC